MNGLWRPKKIKILGMEFAGTVESVGKAVTRFVAGDRVFGSSGVKFGAHAEYVCVPEDSLHAPRTRWTYAVGEGAHAALARHAWYYFAVFAGVVAALVVEPLPSPALGVVGVTLVAVLSRWVLFSPAELAKPEFALPDESLKWALSGFSSDTVWLVFSAFMFALGYERTGLGRRIALVLVKALGKNTLTLGYATALTDAILAPFTPSNTARSAGTIFPVVRNLPPLYGSQPNEPSARKIGGYLMWVTFAAGCVTSSLFMTACAPNLLALEFIRKITKVDITWKQWFFASAPFAFPLLLALPILTYLLYPPQIKRGAEVPAWAASELEKMGRPSRRELILAALALLAIVLWIFGGKYIHVAMVALL